MSDLKIHPVELCNAIGKCMASPQSYASSMPSFGYGHASSKDPARVAAYALQQLEAARQKDVEAHERNLPAIEANKVVRAHIESLMKAIYSHVAAQVRQDEDPDPRFASADDASGHV